MTDDNEVARVRYGKVILKIFIALLTTGLTYIITNLSNQPRVWGLIISVLIGGFTLVVEFLSEFEKRLESVEERLEFHAVEVRSLIKEGFARTHDVLELFQAVEESALRTDTITQLVRHSTHIKPGSPALVYEFAQAQISRMSQFLKELGEGGEVSYDGEDRDWILGLTMQAQRAIDATSMAAVDAGGSGFDDGFWTSDFGQHYLELQRVAVHRGVAIRRVFIFDSPEQRAEPEFLRIYRQQQDLGIRVKTLDRSTIPLALKNLLFDFIVFDEAISYEVTPATRVEETMKPTIVKTNLALQSQRVRERIRRFETLWAAARELNDS